MPLTREPKYKDIYTDEVDQKGGYTAKVKDPKARAAAKEAAETAKADLDAYKETNDAAVAGLDDRLTIAEGNIDDAEADIVAINKRGIYYGECSSAADAVAKTVTLTNGADFTLTKGVAIAIKFTNANTATNPTLAVNGTAAKALRTYGTNAVGSNTNVNAWIAGSVVLLIYDGTAWMRSWWWNNQYTAASATPKMDGTAAVGTSTKYALEDHVHPTNVSDSGWLYLNYTSPFANYDSNTANRPAYRKYGKVVQIRGIATVTAQIPADTTKRVMFTLPSGYRPSLTQDFICQGSGYNKWMLTVSSNGNVTHARYGGTSGGTTNTGNWLTFSATFLVD